MFNEYDKSRLTSVACIMLCQYPPILRRLNPQLSLFPRRSNRRRYPMRLNMTDRQVLWFRERNLGPSMDGFFFKWKCSNCNSGTIVLWGHSLITQGSRGTGGRGWKKLYILLLWGWGQTHSYVTFSKSMFYIRNHDVKWFSKDHI